MLSKVCRIQLFHLYSIYELICDSDFVYSSTFSQKDQFNTTTVLFAGCLSTFTSGSTAVQARNGADDSGLNFTTITGTVTMWGQPISVEFQQQDLSLFTTSTTTSATVSASILTTAQPSNRITQPYSSPTVSTTPSSAPSSSLSGGAKAGIGITVGIGGFLIFWAVVFVFLRSRAMAKRQPYPQQDTQLWKIEELAGLQVRHPVEMSALPTSARQIAELE